MFYLFLWMASLHSGAVAQDRGPQCVFNSDCAEALVCSNGACRAQCRQDRDCYSGWVCRAPEAVNGPLPSASGYRHNRCAPPGFQNRVEVNGSEVRYLPLAPPPVLQTQPVVPRISPPWPSAAGLTFRRADSGRMQVRPDAGTPFELSGEILHQPVPIVQNGFVLVFAVDRNESLLVTRCTATQCNPWMNLGGRLLSPPLARQLREGTVEITALSAERRAMRMRFNPTTNQSSPWEDVR